MSDEDDRTKVGVSSYSQKTVTKRRRKVLQTLHASALCHCRLEAVGHNSGHWATCTFQHKVAWNGIAQPHVITAAFLEGAEGVPANA